MLVEPGNHMPALDLLFSDPRVVTVQSRNVLHGCYSFSVVRRRVDGA